MMHSCMTVAAQCHIMTAGTAAQPGRKRSIFRVDVILRDAKIQPIAPVDQRSLKVSNPQIHMVNTLRWQAMLEMCRPHGKTHPSFRLIYVDFLEFVEEFDRVAIGRVDT